MQFLQITIVCFTLNINFKKITFPAPTEPTTAHKFFLAIVTLRSHKVSAAEFSVQDAVTFSMDIVDLFFNFFEPLFLP